MQCQENVNTRHRVQEYTGQWHIWWKTVTQNTQKILKPVQQENSKNLKMAKDFKRNFTKEDIQMANKGGKCHWGNAN